MKCQCGNELGKGPESCAVCRCVRKGKRGDPIPQHPKSSTLCKHRLSDGTFLVYWKGHNMHTDHWHVAPDGTVLSVKDSGTHYYKRSQIRKNIREITGLSMEDGWTPK